MKKIILITFVLGIIIGGIIVTNPFYILCSPTGWVITDNETNETTEKDDSIFFKNINDKEILSGRNNPNTINDKEILDIK